MTLYYDQYDASIQHRPTIHIKTKKTTGSDDNSNELQAIISGLSTVDTIIPNNNDNISNKKYIYEIISAQQIFNLINHFNQHFKR